MNDSASNAAGRRDTSVNYEIELRQRPAPFVAGLRMGDEGREQVFQLDKFLECEDFAAGVAMCLGRPLRPHDDREEIVRQLNRLVALLDDLLNRQLNRIIHAPAFQRLEAAWRGIDLLCNVLREELQPSGSPVHVKILDISWSELNHDFDVAPTIEQSVIFNLVYEQEFGRGGGHPFGLLVGDYEIRSDITDQDDLWVLEKMAGVAASAFSPFVTNASPQLFELSDFRELDIVSDFGFLNLSHDPRWKRLATKEDARFIGLCLPHVLMRLPYAERPDYAVARNDARKSRASDRLNTFCFAEETRGPDSSCYLWGGAAFALALVVIRSFCRTGWVSDIRGVERGRSGGGLVTELPIEYYQADQRVAKPPVDAVITDDLEKELSDHGFISLCACHGTPYTAFYSGRSIQQSKEYYDELATMNAKLSSMLHHMLCVSRFAHILKRRGRDMIGARLEAADIQTEFEDWIRTYTLNQPSATLEQKSRFPLRDADIKVSPIAGKSGTYRAVFDLLPHYEIESVSATIRLITEL